MGAFRKPATGDRADRRTRAPDAIPAAPAPAVAVPVVGGAMGLSTGAGKVFVRTTLFTKSGVLELVPDRTCPPAGLPGRAAPTASARTPRSSTPPPRGVRGTQTFGTTVDEFAGRLDVPLPAPEAWDTG
ncbi:hypothetical protein ACFU5P_04845 [Streptomyces sp. NPDC057433]|uniref:hypothetical protein n=1 Tax=Streptomyces sp. NPDC057433 TaxID=3346132 RepID=UPI00369A141E